MILWYEQTKISNNRKLKAMENVTPSMDPYLRNRQMMDTDLQSDMSC